MAGIPVEPWQDPMFLRFEELLETMCWNPALRENRCNGCRILRCCARKFDAAAYWSSHGMLDQPRIDRIMESLSRESAKIRLKVTP